MADSGTTTGMALFMLEVEERLLKTQAHILYKEKTLNIRIENIQQYLDALFQIAFYKYPVEYESLLPRNFQPPQLVVSTLYWKIWQIMLIICVLDPKEFGLYAWNNYPILKLFIKIIITEDYNFPTQASITN
jgi:integrator complex subunit 1